MKESKKDEEIKQKKRSLRCRMTNYLSRVDIGFIRPRLLHTKLITKKYADINRGFVHELRQIPEDIPVDSIIYLLFL